MTSLVRRRPLVFSLLTAVLLWCAYPGGGEVWPLLGVALVPLLAVMPEVSGRRSLVIGLGVGLLHHLLLLYWIVTVLGRYGGLPVFAAVFALLMLALYMSVYLAFFAGLARLILLHVQPLGSLLAVPALWVGMDWLRAQLFTGFPWMDIGYALADVPRLIQLAEIFGHSSISFLIVLVNTLIVLLVRSTDKGRDSLRLGGAVILLLAAVTIYNQSSWRMTQERLSLADTATLLVGIVQGNIDQSEKWSPENQQRTLRTYLDSSRQLFTEPRPELIVWPETALPFYPQTYPGTGELYGFTAQYDTALLTGAPWFEVLDRKTRDIRYYNSAQLIEPGSGFTQSYYKSHLVPFGEYVPLKKLLPFLAPLVEAVGDFSPGTVERPFEWRGAHLGTLICFESIFPDIARKWVKSGATSLVNLTNDAWYGKSSAPYHSMAMTVFRAVETRRSIIRSANTGVSGFIDPMGRVVQPSGIFTGWAQVEPVVQLGGETVFVRYGYLFAPFCLVVGVLVAGRACRRKK